MKTPEERMQEVIFSELDKNEYKVFLFWSRAVWNNRENSDYDIWILWEKKLDYLKYLKLKRLLQELPYLIDLVDFAVVSDDFKSLALTKILPWN